MVMEHTLLMVIGTHSGLYDGGWMRQVWEQGLMSHDDVMNFIYEYSLKNMI